jgi:Asp/Glu/hydantoin racemase
MRVDKVAKVRIGVLSPVNVALPAVKDAFLDIWPEADPICLLDESLYADFVNSDFTVQPDLPEEAYTRIANLFQYSKNTGVEGIIFCGSVFGALVEEGRKGLDIPVLTSFEGMIEEAFSCGPRIGIVTTAEGSLSCLVDDINRYAQTNLLECSIKSEVADGAFQKALDGDIEGSDAMVIKSASLVTECDSLMLGQFSMGRVARKIVNIIEKPVLTAPECAVKKMKSLIEA